MRYVIKLNTENSGWITYSDTGDDHIKLFDTRAEATVKAENIMKRSFLRQALIKRFTDEFTSSEIFDVIPEFKDYWYSTIKDLEEIKEYDVVGVEL